MNDDYGLLKVLFSVFGLILILLAVEYIFDIIDQVMQFLKPAIMTITFVFYSLVFLLLIIIAITNVFGKFKQKLIHLKDSTKYKTLKNKIRIFRKTIGVIIFAIFEFFKGFLISTVLTSFISVALDYYNLIIIDIDVLNTISLSISIIIGLITMIVFIRDPR